MTIEIRLASPSERAPAEALAARSFGPGRFAKSAYRLREGVLADVRLSFVAIKNGVIAGTVQYWPIAIGGRLSVLLGPLAVDAAARGQGTGLELMRVSLPEAARLGYAAAILVGDEPYYAKVGFKKLEAGAVTMPGPVNPYRLLGLPLDGGPLEQIRGPVLRPWIDERQCANATALPALSGPRPATP
jgi:predicted N-acetyltransferase YhbS